jgi:hypothetical protein
VQGSWDSKVARSVAVRVSHSFSRPSAPEDRTCCERGIGALGAGRGGGQGECELRKWDSKVARSVAVRVSHSFKRPSALDDRTCRDQGGGGAGGECGSRKWDSKVARSVAVRVSHSFSRPSAPEDRT